MHGHPGLQYKWNRASDQGTPTVGESLAESDRTVGLQDVGGRVTPLRHFRCDDLFAKEASS